MDDIFTPSNFCALIPFVTTGGVRQNLLAERCAFLLWYAKDISKVKYRQIYQEKTLDSVSTFTWLELPDGSRRGMTSAEKEDPSRLPTAARVYRAANITTQGNPIFPFRLGSKVYSQPWKTTAAGLERLAVAKRLHVAANSLSYVQYLTDFPVSEVTRLWTDTFLGSFAEPKVFVVQTSRKTVERCLLMTTDPGDLVLDPTCGSGTTAFGAEDWGRCWITCDTSRVAITLAKQRLMTSKFDYYELAHPEEGVGSGFRYKTVPHVTLKSIANNLEIREGMAREQVDATIARHAEQETLYDQPYGDKGRVRVTGPFTVEAVPAPTVRSVEDFDLGPAEQSAQPPLSDFRDAATPLLDASVARKGPTLRQAGWRDELLKTGLRGRGGHHIDFSRVESLAGTRWLHADAETKGAKPERVVFSFGPEYSLLEQRQVELAWEEARTLSPKPAILVFAAFEFDPEAAKDIDGMTKEKTGMTFLTAQMNADLLTEDLKKKRASNQGFWLVGRPDVDLRRAKREKAKYEVEVRGFDYYNTRTGTIDSGDASRVAMWLLDTDYDGRSLYPRQVFFPMAGDDEGWARLARNLKAEIDSELIEKYRGTVSLPFEAGSNKRIAVKIIDDRGIESLKVVDLK